MLLALAARPEELELLLISVTYGNVGVQEYVIMFSCVPTFHCGVFLEYFHRSTTSFCAHMALDILIHLLAAFAMSSHFFTSSTKSRHGEKSRVGRRASIC